MTRSGLFYARCLALGSLLLASFALVLTVAAPLGAPTWPWAAGLWICAALYALACADTVRRHRRLVYDLRTQHRARQSVRVSVRVLSRAGYEARLEELWAEPDENLRHSLRVVDGGAS